jgi:hypothetical protein
MMTESRQKYRPPQPGPLNLRDSVRLPLLVLAGGEAPEAHLEISRVEGVERVLLCELPDEILACFANGDSTLQEWGFDLGEVADHTAQAREVGCRANLIAVGRDPGGHILYCVERKGDRHRAVSLIVVDTEENGDIGYRDLGAWLAERARLEDETRPEAPPVFVQRTFWPDAEPIPRVWRLVV